MQKNMFKKNSLHELLTSRAMTLMRLNIDATWNLTYSCINAEGVEQQAVMRHAIQHC